MPVVWPSVPRTAHTSVVSQGQMSVVAQCPKDSIHAHTPALLLVPKLLGPPSLQGGSRIQIFGDDKHGHPVKCVPVF